MSHAALRGLAGLRVSCANAALSRVTEHHFTLFSAPCGVMKRLRDVVSFEVRVVGEQLVHRLAGSDLTDDHADRGAHTANARLSTHHRRVLRNTVQSFHSVTPCYQWYGKHSTSGRLIALDLDRRLGFPLLRQIVGKLHLHQVSIFGPKAFSIRSAISEDKSVRSLSSSETA